MTKLKCLIYFALISTGQLLADSPNWSLRDTKSGWNDELLVSTYFHNSNLQTQWAFELLGKEAFRGDEQILDFGCGDGKISAIMSQFVSKGHVTGVDISSEMLGFANIKFPNYAYSNLHFVKSNSLKFEDFNSNQTYDMITSFCVFHQVSDPLMVLKNIKVHLNQKGKLILVIPAGKNPAFFQAANELFAKYQLEAPWKNASSGPRQMRTMVDSEFFLKEAGFTIQKLEMIDTDNPFYNKQELVDWFIGTLSANWNIPLPINKTFFTEFVDRMCELDSDVIDKVGRVHYKLSRMHVVATPNAQ